MWHCSSLLPVSEWKWVNVRNSFVGKKSVGQAGNATNITLIPVYFIFRLKLLLLKKKEIKIQNELSNMLECLIRLCRKEINSEKGIHQSCYFLKVSSCEKFDYVSMVYVFCLEMASHDVRKFSPCIRPTIPNSFFFFLLFIIRRKSHEASRKLET